MSDFIQEFQFYMSYPFVRYALIVGVLIALCSSLLGVTPVSYTHLDVYKRQTVNGSTLWRF